LRPTKRPIVASPPNLERQATLADLFAQLYSDLSPIAREKICDIADPPTQGRTRRSGASDNTGGCT
jgi:hypothetical protein